MPLSQYVKIRRATPAEIALRDKLTPALRKLMQDKRVSHTLVQWRPPYLGFPHSAGDGSNVGCMDRIQNAMIPLVRAENASRFIAQARYRASDDYFSLHLQFTDS